MPRAQLRLQKPPPKRNKHHDTYLNSNNNGRAYTQYYPMNSANLKYLTIFCALLSFQANANVSTCFGTTSKGYLENGIKLPSKGNNFESYSTLGNLLGRTYVHSAVHTIIINAFQRLEDEHPDKVFKYAETGFEQGGPFRPHRTHQNGLSVDFMSPINNQKGISVHLPTNPMNKWGYNIEFDEDGKFEEYSIDFEALAAHIVALHKESKKLGYDLWRVIFDPKFQPKLFTTQHADYLRTHVQFSKKASWVRHDEHYHVDFEVPCK